MIGSANSSRSMHALLDCLRSNEFVYTMGDTKGKNLHCKLKNHRSISDTIRNWRHYNSFRMTMLIFFAIRFIFGCKATQQGMGALPVLESDA